METLDLILALLVISALFWYFNIRGSTKCITYNPECSGVNCVKQKFN